MNSVSNLVYQVITNPALTEKITLEQWDSLVPQLKNANLLARLCVLIEEEGGIERIPESVRRHLQSAKIVAEKNKRGVIWEVHCIKEALKDVVDKIILLKGGAYIMANVPASNGRIFSDVDILVQKKDIGNVETRLMINGWMTTENDAYNQKYYRKWMHEIPPMQHLQRKTTIDVHHAIVPDTSRLHFDVNKLIDMAIPLKGEDKVYVLAPLDMILHSATHLFCDGELEHGLRDLVDLDSLLRHFSAREDSFWPDLIERAKVLGLVRPMYYMLHYANRLLNSPVPDEILKSSKIGKPNPILSAFMDVLFIRALAPDHPDCNDLLTGTSRWILYIRSHYLRMPLYLLIPHLIRKAMKNKDKEDNEL